MAVWVLAANPFRQFYEALGGKLVAEQQIDRGGQSFTESAYGWQDLTTFGDTDRPPAASRFAHDQGPPAFKFLGNGLRVHQAVESCR